MRRLAAIIVAVLVASCGGDSAPTPAGADPEPSLDVADAVLDVAADAELDVAADADAPDAVADVADADAAPDATPDAAFSFPEGLVGEPVPDRPLPPSFSGVVDQDGAPVLADQLLGSWHVLWFYPKASTAG